MYQILALQESERGCLTEIITCNNLAGYYILLQITFLQKNMKLELKHRTSSSIYTCVSPLVSLFTQWSCHFIQHVKKITYVRHSKNKWNFNAINVG
jgi:hypothetical protein